MTTSEFFWAAGHIGWPLFGIVVFSILCVLVTDIVWRIARMPFRRLLFCALLVWLIGAVGQATWYFLR